MDSIIVRDTKLSVDKQIISLEKGSALEALLSGRHFIHSKDGVPYIDRDPKPFKMVLEFLKNQKKMPSSYENNKTRDLFMQELDYWGILPKEQFLMHYIFDSEP